MVVILFTTQAPHPLSGELSMQGHEVYEALAISEVLTLAEQHQSFSIIITSEVDQVRATVIQQHWPTVHLHKDFTRVDVSQN